MCQIWYNCDDQQLFGKGGGGTYETPYTYFKLIYTVNDSFRIKKNITLFGFTLKKSAKIEKIELKSKTSLKS